MAIKTKKEFDENEARGTIVKLTNKFQALKNGLASVFDEIDAMKIKFPDTEDQTMLDGLIDQGKQIIQNEIDNR